MKITNIHPTLLGGSMKPFLMLLVLLSTYAFGQTVRTADLISGEEVVWVDPISCGRRVSITPLIISRADTISEVLYVIGSDGTWLLNPKLEVNGQVIKGNRKRTWLNEQLYAGNYVERFTVKVSDTLVTVLMNKPFARLVGELRSTDSLDVAYLSKTTKTLLSYVRHVQQARSRE